MNIYKFSIFALVSVILYHPPSSAADQNNKSKTLLCSEMDGNESDGPSDGNTDPVARIQINYTANGTISSIVGQRKATQELPAMKFSFTSAHDEINDIARATGDDSKTGECKSQYCIANIQTISAKSKSGDSITLNINDHAYAGLPGSTLAYQTGGKVLETSKSGNMVNCIGRVKFPWNREGSEDLLK